MLPMLTGEVQQIHAANESTGWELYGHRSVRQGDWKIVWDPREKETARWYLFNLAEDIEERNDLSDQEPVKRQQMIKLWDRYAEENGVIY